MTYPPTIAGLTILLPETADAYATELRMAAEDARVRAIHERREGRDALYLQEIAAARGLESLAADFTEHALHLRSADPTEPTRPGEPTTDPRRAVLTSDLPDRDRRHPAMPPTADELAARDAARVEVSPTDQEIADEVFRTSYDHGLRTTAQEVASIRAARASGADLSRWGSAIVRKVAELEPREV